MPEVETGILGKSTEVKGFQVNIKTKIMVGSANVEIEGKFSCAVCRKDLGINTILSNSITYLLTSSFEGVGCIRDIVVLEVS